MDVNVDVNIDIDIGSFNTVMKRKEGRKVQDHS